MKTQKKNSQGLDFKTRNNNHWKWMAGATAATAGGVTGSQASIITISLVNNFIGSGNYLNADLTGDGHPDLAIANAASTLYNATVTLNGVRADVFHREDGVDHYWSMGLGSRRAFYNHPFPSNYSGETYGTPSLMGSIPIFFKDLHINGGAPTTGSLQVTVGITSHGSGISLDSLTYNTPVADLTSLTYNTRNNVPDQGSTLALLAMGASGVFALRRWRGLQRSC